MNFLYHINIAEFDERKEVVMSKNDKKKRLKKEQERRRIYNKENKAVISYEEYYKNFMGTNLACTEWLENKDDPTKGKITYILDYLPKTNILENEYKFIESLEAFVEQCEKLYSVILLKNENLKKKANKTIVNYYRGCFEINMSREISFLPLEFRLYIYIELVKQEINKYYLVCLLNRIMVTLSKMENVQAYESSLFIVSWAEYLLFLTTEYKSAYEQLSYDGFKQNGKFRDILRLNRQHSSMLINTREKTMQSAMLDGAKKLDQEFWYGINGFSDKKNIHDIKAAKLCLDLFCDYFDKIFFAASEFRHIVLEYYCTGKRDKVAAFSQKHMLDEIHMKSYKIYFHMNDEKIKAEENKEKSYHLTLGPENGIEYDYLYLYNRNFEETTFFSDTELPEKISQKEYYLIIKKFLKKLSLCKNIYLPDIEEYIISITTAMLNSKDWNMYLLNFFLYSLQMLLKQMWEYDEKINITEQCESTWKYMLLLKEESIEYLGFGAPTAFFITGNGALAVNFDEFDKPFFVCPRLTTSPSVTLDTIRGVFESKILSEEAILSDSYKMFPANTVFLSWRLYEKKLAKEVISIRQAGWKRIQEYHFANGYHISKDIILKTLQERLENVKSQLEYDSSKDLTSILDDILYTYIKYIVSRNFEIPYFGDCGKFIKELKKKGYHGKLEELETAYFNRKKINLYYLYLLELISENKEEQN